MNQDNIPTLPSAKTTASKLMAVGALIDGRFETVEKLGEGGMCVVYLAHDTAIDRLVAIKHLRLDVDSKHDAQRLRQECLAVAALDHRNIVKTFMTGFWNNRPYLVMEYLKGRTLAQILKQQERLEQTEALPIFQQLADALAFAHDKGVIHRDIKPSNVMVLDDGTVKLLDFGLAKMYSSAQHQSLTDTGSLLGTIGYISPEQCSGGDADCRSDLYSLGCLMYEAIEGHLPFEGSTAMAVLAKHVQKRPPACKYASAWLSKLISKLLDKDPRRRPRSAHELKDNLLVSRTERAPAKRIPRVQMVSGAVLASVLIIGLASAHIFRKPPIERSAMRCHVSQAVVACIGWARWKEKPLGQAAAIAALDGWLKEHPKAEGEQPGQDYLAILATKAARVLDRNLPADKDEAWKLLAEAHQLQSKLSAPGNPYYVQALNDMAYQYRHRNVVERERVCLLYLKECCETQKKRW